jgi:thiamine-monophosphate kinase
VSIGGIGVAALGEFELIARYFERPGGPRRALLGIGDDCALLPPLDCLAVSTDMLVAGRHFFADVDPNALGHKTLAVNLSDLAAMGASPVAFTLALALPEVDEPWLRAFADGLFALADVHDCELVGGDTTRGPLNLCVTVFGEVPRELALRRDGARAGDDVWVSGELGAAAWAVAVRAGGAEQAGGTAEAGGSRGVASPALLRARARLDRPQPRVALGLVLRGLASAAIDLSDGLCGDLQHVLDRSGAARGESLGAEIDWPAVPVDAALDGLPAARRVALSLAGGDDYELLFCAAPARREALAAAAGALGLRITRIGRIEAGAGLRVRDADGRTVPIDARSFDHFRTA